MAVYNGERFLRLSIESILFQTFADFEFIIVDDGSTDKTWSILCDYADSRIRLIQNEENIGLTRSLNKGSALVQGEFIARMDADDISHPLRLEKQYAYMNDHPDVGVLGCQMEQIDVNGRKIDNFHAPLFHEAIAWKMLFETSIAHPTVMMRRRDFTEAGGYDPSFIYAQDLELWSRMVHVTWFANLPESLHSRRWHRFSICSLHSEKQFDLGLIVRHRLYERILNRKIDKELVDILSKWSGRRTSFPDCDRIKQAISLMVELFEALTKGNCLVPEELNTLREDLIVRSISLSRPQLKDVRMWAVLGWTWKYDLILVWKIATRRLCRAMSPSIPQRAIGTYKELSGTDL